MTTSVQAGSPARQGQTVVTPAAPADSSANPPRTRLKVNWANSVFMASAHVLAVVAIVYLTTVYFSWMTLGFGLIWITLCGLSITAGYHRLFAHRAYTASPVLRAIYLLFGAASVQNSALVWASDHRTHHAHVDREGDPYSIKRGFWWAHIGWVICKNLEPRRPVIVKDLESDTLVRLQHRFYLPLALLFGAGLPAAIGSAWGDPIGAMLVAGFLRLVVQWHGTFAVNSFAHLLGRQPYSTSNSARDSFFVSLITFGEGYHNFHHRFQRDYRNGIRWFHWDPTKWCIWLAAKIRLASDLRRTEPDRILTARMACAAPAAVSRRASRSGASATSDGGSRKRD